jgi:hypothetical protein
LQLHRRWPPLTENINLLNDEKIYISIFQSNSGAQLKQEEIELGLPFMVPDLVYKFQMFCLCGKYRWTDMGKL